MKIRELIGQLLLWPMDSDIFINDADTDWTLPIHVGYGPYGKQADDDNVYIYGDYSERIK